MILVWPSSRASGKWAAAAAPARAAGQRGTARRTCSASNQVGRSTQFPVCHALPVLLLLLRGGGEGHTLTPAAATAHPLCCAGAGVGLAGGAGYQGSGQLLPAASGGAASERTGLVGTSYYISPEIANGWWVVLLACRSHAVSSPSPLPPPPPRACRIWCTALTSATAAQKAAMCAGSGGLGCRAAMHCTALRDRQPLAGGWCCSCHREPCQTAAQGVIR